MYDAMRRSKVVFALLLIAASSSPGPGTHRALRHRSAETFFSLGATGELREEALRVLTTAKANGPAPFAPV